MEPDPFANCSRDLQQAAREARLARVLAERLLFDPDLADDAIQQTWLSLLEHPPRDPEHAGGWFTAIAKNCALKILRTRIRSLKRELASEIRNETAPSPPEILDRAALTTLLREAVEQLPEPYRRTLRARFYEGLPPRQIAAHEGVTVDAVRSRQQRGLAMLRAKLDSRLDENQRSTLALGLFGMASRPSPRTVVDLVARSIASHATLPIPLRGARGRLFTGAIVTLVVIASFHAVTLLSTRDAVEGTTEVQSAGAPNRADGNHERTLQRVAFGESELTPVGSHLPHSMCGLEVVVTRERDGAPAAGIRIEALCFADPNPQLKPRVSITDAHGRATWPDAPAGPARILLDRGGQRDVEIAVIGITSVMLDLAVGIDVHGTVRDALGRAVAGAAIWLGDDDRGSRGSALTVSNADGRFSLGDVAPGCMIGAWHPEHAPTALSAVAGIRGTSTEMTLTLAARPAILRGRLLDANGHGVAGRVRIEATADDAPPSLAAADVALPPPLEIDCDPEGRFEARGLRSGRARVRARSPLHAAIERTLDLPPDAALDCTLDLAGGASVAGCVLGGGAPIPFAFVRFGEGLAFEDALVRADALGHFSLLGLPEGRLEVRVDCALGHGEQMLTTRFGETTQHDFEIMAGITLEGLVVHTDSSDSADFRELALVLEPIDGGTLFGTRTCAVHESGALEVHGLRAGRYRASITSQTAGSAANESTILAARTIVLPLSERLVLEIAAPLAPGRLEGEIREPTAQPAFVEIVDALGLTSSRTVACDATGCFRIEALRPGDYYLRAMDRAGRRGRFITATIETGRTTRTRIPLPGLATLEINLTPTAAAHDTALRVFDDSGICVLDRATLEPNTRVSLPPGDYSVRTARRAEAQSFEPTLIGDARVRGGPGSRSRNDAPPTAQVLESSVTLIEGETHVLRLDLARCGR